IGVSGEQGLQDGFISMLPAGPFNQRKQLLPYFENLLRPLTVDCTAAGVGDAALFKILQSVQAVQHVARTGMAGWPALRTATPKERISLREHRGDKGRLFNRTKPLAFHQQP